MHTEPITDEIREAFCHKKRNTNAMRVEDTTLDDAAESGNDENWRFLGNESTCNDFINVKYPSNIRNSPDGKYLHVHCNAGVTRTNKIGDLPGY